MTGNKHKCDNAELNLHEYYLKFSLKEGATRDEQLHQMKDVILTILKECQKREYGNERIADEICTWIKLQVRWY